LIQLHKPPAAMASSFFDRKLAVRKVVVRKKCHPHFCSFDGTDHSATAGNIWRSSSGCRLTSRGRDKPYFCRRSHDDAQHHR